MDKLKIYSAYLPYGLKLQYFDDEREILHNDCKIVGFREDEMTIANNEYQYDVKFYDVKPILFSLEDLTREITIGGETFVPFDELIKIKNVRLRVEKYENGDKKLLNINTFSFSLFDFEYKIIEKLLEWKFNVFNIPETEYIKVTEENNPYK